MLKTACEGRLVPTEAELARAENRDYEPADRLLQRILAERRARWHSQPKRRRKYKDPARPDTSTLPDLPEGMGVGDLVPAFSEARYRRPRRTHETRIHRGWGSVSPIAKRKSEQIRT